ncbi:kinase-like domain-containing protein [Mycena leptocephala]|nr:kinase-like domain-containing protein [Mycena leptocephala]
MSNVALKEEHPVIHGGFSNIYLGRYEDSNGIQHDVALKVLKIFENQTEEAQVILYRKFVKEALVWHFLRHECIVPFLGVLSSMRLPSMAMVSPWMPRGSVLKYVEEHSPHSPASLYAMNLLHDVIRGLEYLHSENVVHGDLCGRNILIDKDGRARLSDFGLASFIDSETSIKSSTRGGSTRWMAPELLLPPPECPFRRTSASDIWAFGCVCCEIWSEGIVPFRRFSDMGLILAINEGATTGLHESPYPSRPHDGSAHAMPDRLWDLSQWCFQYAPLERPTVEVLAAMISEMTEGSGAVSEVPTVPDNPALSLNSFQPLTMVPVPSTFLTENPAIGKGKRRVRFEKETATVRFGPIDDAQILEELFPAILENLGKIVPPGGLPEPILVEQDQHDDHLALNFSTPAEAKTFSETWTTYRFHPYLQAAAIVVEDDDGRQT